MEFHNPTWFPNLKYIDTFCAQKCCSSLALKVTVCANDTERRKGELIRVLSTGSPVSLSDRSTLYLNKMCSITLVLRFLWGKTLFPSPWRSTKIVHSYHLSQTWGYSEKKKKCFMSPGHSSTGCWQQQQQKQSGWKRSWSKKWYYQDTSYESLSPALCKSLTPSLPLASQRSPSVI